PSGWNGLPRHRPLSNRQRRPKGGSETGVDAWVSLSWRCCCWQGPALPSLPWPRSWCWWCLCSGRNRRRNDHARGRVRAGFGSTTSAPCAVARLSPRGTPMLMFQLFAGAGESGAIHIDPDSVAAIIETERTPPHGSTRQVAVLILTTGQEFTVLDDGRD